MSQIPPKNSVAHDEHDVDFDFLNADVADSSQRTIGDELDDLSFLDQLGADSTSPPVANSASSNHANDPLEDDDFFAQLGGDTQSDVKSPTNQTLDNDPLIAAVPIAQDNSPKPKKSLFSFGKKTDKASADKTSKAASDTPKKSLFSFGKKTDKASAGKASKAASDTPKKSLLSSLNKKTEKASADRTSKAASDTPKKSVFGRGAKAESKPTPIKPSKTKTAATLTKTPKSTNKNTTWIALGGLLSLLLLLGAWFLTQSEEPAADIAPTVVSVPAIQPEVQPAVVEAPVVTAQATDSATDQPLITQPPQIDTQAIAQAEIPQDPALIKEEIDRLSDKNTRFQEQAQLIDEQLGKLEELTAAKEEKIALLEAQIAQLEAQKKQ